MRFAPSVLDGTRTPAGRIAYDRPDADPVVGAALVADYVGTLLAGARAGGCRRRATSPSGTG